MDNIKLLVLLNDGEIKKVREIAFKELYIKQINKNEKSRFSAMKRYLHFNNKNLPQYLSVYKVNNEYGFIDGDTIVLTKENIKDLPLNKDNIYIDTHSFSISNKCSIEIDINKILIVAQINNYKFKKSNIFKCPLYVLNVYGNIYANLMELQKAFDIINDNKPSKVFYSNNTSAIVIQTSIGKMGIIPLINPSEESIIINNNGMVL